MKKSINWPVIIKAVIMFLSALLGALTGTNI